MYSSQKLGEDFEKFCDRLRIGMYMNFKTKNSNSNLSTIQKFKNQ